MNIFNGESKERGVPGKRPFEVRARLGNPRSAVDFQKDAVSRMQIDYITCGEIL